MILSLIAAAGETLKMVREYEVCSLMSCGRIAGSYFPQMSVIDDAKTQGKFFIGIFASDCNV